jgi:hypothetical protein
MDDDVKYSGVCILNYSERVMGIIGSLSEASLQVDLAKALLESEETYEGKARAEMRLFLDAYAARVEQLIVFQSAAQRFLQLSLESFADTEEKLLEVVDAWLEEHR